MTAIGFSHSTCTPASAARIGVFGMQRVGQGDVDRVHLLEARVVFVVRVRAFEPVLSSRAALRLVRSSLTSATRRELRLAWANAGSTATCAMWPSPTTAYRTMRFDVWPSATSSSARRGRLRELLRDDFRDGTFAPFSRASLSPMAIACLRLVTFRPDPLFSVPFFLRRIADLTFFAADLPYFAMQHLRVLGPANHVLTR